jgi:ATP-dependent DNA ligase
MSVISQKPTGRRDFPHTFPNCTLDSVAMRSICNDLTRRFPFIAMAVAALPVPSCLIDGEAIVSDDDGLAIFDRIRGHGALADATLCAFDLLQVDGRDLRRERAS